MPAKTSLAKVKKHFRETEPQRALYISLLSHLIFNLYSLYQKAAVFWQEVVWNQLLRSRLFFNRANIPCCFINHSAVDGGNRLDLICSSCCMRRSAGTHAAFISCRSWKVLMLWSLVHNSHCSVFSVTSTHWFVWFKQQSCCSESLCWNNHLQFELWASFNLRRRRLLYKQARCAEWFQSEV